MAEYESYGFFNAEETSAGVYDRSYNAEQFAQYFALFIGTGVFADPLNQLQVTSKSAMTVTVRPGWAFIDGYWYHLSQAKDIVVPLNQTGAAKTHSVCCTLDKLQRKVTVNLRQDVGAGAPRNNDTYHDLVLALINVAPNVTQITNSSITDKRPDESFCGYVAGVIDQIDATDMFQQMEAQFNEWFTDIKEEFGDDPAGGLQSQIDALKTGKQDAITGAVSTMTSNNAIANRVIVSAGNGKLTSSGITTDNLNGLEGLNMNVNQVLGLETLRFRGVIQSEGLLNNARNQGFYFVNNANLSFFDGATWGHLIVLKSASYNCTDQIITNGDKMFIRQYSGSPESWGEWRRIARCRLQNEFTTTKINGWEIRYREVVDGVIYVLGWKTYTGGVNQANDVEEITLPFTAGTTHFLPGHMDVANAIQTQPFTAIIRDNKLYRMNAANSQSVTLRFYGTVYE